MDWILLTFRYFAYGSNLWPPQMRSRCPSARFLTVAELDGWALTCDRPSVDGSAKFNIRRRPGSVTHGVVYEIDEGERTRLDRSGPLGTPLFVDAGGVPAVSHAYEGPAFEGRPYDWYVATARAGASVHGVPAAAHQVAAEPDPMAPGVAPIGREGLAEIQAVLAAGLASGGSRYYAHPGDAAWWVYHDDPRHPDHLSIWIQEGVGFTIVDAADPGEINVFTRPGEDRMPLIRWAQRRLSGKGEVAWVADSDGQLVSALRSDGYEPGRAYRSYEWDLRARLPTPLLPRGWELRHLHGEPEANARRAAAHAAFGSSMPEAMHLQRYLDFMRSPAYVSENDLVAVSPEGKIAAFMIWWPDTSGIAQIEPFGTHPDFQRRGLGRALIHFGLARMREAGMTRARVVTDEWRPATRFYEAVGFTDAGRVRWWAKANR